MDAPRRAPTCRRRRRRGRRPPSRAPTPRRVGAAAVAAATFHDESSGTGRYVQSTRGRSRRRARGTAQTRAPTPYPAPRAKRRRRRKKSGHIVYPAVVAASFVARRPRRSGAAVVAPRPRSTAGLRRPSLSPPSLLCFWHSLTTLLRARAAVGPGSVAPEPPAPGGSPTGSGSLVGGRRAYRDAPSGAPAS